MDLPPPSMHAYADVPAVVQARGAQSPLLVDAVKALSDARALTITLPRAPAPAVTGGDLPNEPLAVEPIAEVDYDRLIQGMRTRIVKEVPTISGFGIKVLDNGGPGAVSDAKRQFGADSLAARSFVEYYHLKGNSPFSSFVEVNANSAACVIMPAPPAMTMADFKQTAYGGRINTGSATARDFQGWVGNHELGHCLLGPDETSADVFGMLVMIHDGAPRDLIASVAALRESNELLSRNNNDDYFVTAAAGWLARNYDRIRADKVFMASDMKGIAQTAKGVSDKFRIDDMTKSDHKLVRLMLVAAQSLPSHTVRDLDGKERSVDFDGWLQAHAREVPLFARVLDLKHRLQDGPSNLPKPFTVDGGGTMAAVAAMAQAGDATAKAMLDKAMKTGFPPPVVSPLRTAYVFKDVRHAAVRLFDREAPPHEERHAEVEVVESDAPTPYRR